MQLDSAESLIQALWASGLFNGEQLRAMTRELAPLGDNPRAMMRQLVQDKRITHYQLTKVVQGRASELIVGQYVITDKLGQGGMGKVYRARQTRMDRTVALKIVRAALLANATVRGRYQREVQASSQLEHENIVKLYDAGEADGRVYLAMEFVDGIDLARLMHEHQSLEVVEACEYARQAALGLQHAHERGFIHRDIKPSNLIVAGERHLPQATEPSIVKLLDLGLSRAIDPDEMVLPDLTRDHTVVGTPDYMAPEQAKSSKFVDHRADLYSLGCTLYFLLTGRVPFPGGNAIEKLLQHYSDPPPPLQALRPSVPGDVAELVARLMAKRPEDRIQSAGELAAALESLAAYPPGSAPVLVRPAWESNVFISGPTSDSLPDDITMPASPAEASSLDSRSDVLSVSAPTPRPVGSAAFRGLNDPPSGEHAVANVAILAEAAARRRASLRKWLGVSILAAFVMAIAGWLVVRKLAENRDIPAPTSQPNARTR